MEDIGVDLEDLEAMLYSQVYHGNVDDPDNNTSSLQNVARQAQRYRVNNIGNSRMFHNRYFDTSEINQVLEEQVNPPEKVVFNYAASNANVPPSAVVNLPNSTAFDSNLSNCSRQVPVQPYYMNPVNNIVLIPPLITTATSEKLFKNLYKKQKRKERAKQRKLESLLKKKSLVRQKESDSGFIIHGMNAPKQTNSSARNETEKSDSSDVEIITVPQPVICISDDEKNEKASNTSLSVSSDKSKKNMTKNDPIKGRIVEGANTLEVANAKEENVKTERAVNVKPYEIEDDDDDVIFVELDKQNEIIDLDPEDSEVVKPKTASNIITPKEREEILSTPESNASNDFLDSSNLELQQENFNFDLHGVDFGPSTSNQFLRPKTPVGIMEAYETESSCSASDIGLNSKDVEFHEINFDSPSKNLFSDNLENFRNYITTKRKLLPNIPTLLTSKDDQTITTRCSNVGSKTDSDDSSSESDYESSRSKIIDRISKVRNKSALPTLSAISSDDGSDQQHVKNKKQKSKIASEPGSAKKGKKKKKKGFETNSTEQESTTEEGKYVKFNFKINDENFKELSTINNIPVKKKRKSNEGNTSIQDDSENGSKNSKKIKTRDEIISSTEKCSENVVSSTNVYLEENKKKPKHTESIESFQDEFDTANKKQKKSKKKDKEEITSTFDVDSNSNRQISIDNDDEAQDTTDNLQPATKFRKSIEKTSDKRSSFPSTSAYMELSVDSNSNDSSIYMLSELDKVDTELQLANCSAESQTVSEYKEKSSKKRKRFKDYFTSDMNKFYNESWGLEDFSVEEIQATMSDDPKLWKILEQDKSYLRMLTPKGTRCHRCREVGHFSNRCPNRNTLPSCSLCGERGHLEPRCPNKMCTQCGRRGSYTTVYCSKCIHERNSRCKICHMFGHIQERCPDLWRRYHSTTTEQHPETLKGSQLIPYKKRWCSGCGSNGHLEYSCQYYNRTHPPVDPCVRSYKEIYGFKKPTSIERQIHKTSSKNLPETITDPNRIEDCPIQELITTPNIIIQIDNVDGQTEAKSTSEDNKVPAVTENTNTETLTEKKKSNENTQFDVNRTDAPLLSVPKPPQITVQIRNSDKNQTDSSANHTNVAPRQVYMQPPQAPPTALQLLNANISKALLMTPNFFAFPVANPINQILGVNAHQVQNMQQNLPVNANPIENVFNPASKKKNHVIKKHSIKRTHAQFLLEDIPGIDLIHDLETGANVRIKVDVHPNSATVLIEGPKVKVSIVLSYMKRFFKDEVKALQFPSESQEIPNFIDNLFRFSTNCSLTTLLMQLTKWETKLRSNEMKNKKDQTIGIKLQLLEMIRRNTYIANKLCFAIAKMGEAKKHCNFLQDFKRECLVLPASTKISAAKLETIKDSFYFLFYRKRSLDEYRSHLKAMNPRFEWK